MFYDVDRKNLKVDLNECIDLTTMVFVDFENFAFGCLDQYKQEPIFNEFYDDLKKRCVIDQMMIFADWNERKLKPYASRLKSFGGILVDCSKAGRRENEEYEEDKKSKDGKDVADFIMLDQIYQSYIRYKHIDQFVLLTGDKHFQSVVGFLKTFETRKPKVVGLYSLEGSCSEELADAADWTVKISLEKAENEYSGLNFLNNEEMPLAIEIIKCLKHTEKLIEDGRDISPTFGKTSEIASTYLRVPLISVRNVLNKMIINKCVTQMDTVGRNGPTRKISLNWDILAKA